MLPKPLNLNGMLWWRIRESALRWHDEALLLQQRLHVEQNPSRESHRSLFPHGELTQLRAGHEFFQ
jgi:hypothetical protein